MNNESENGSDIERLKKSVLDQFKVMAGNCDLNDATVVCLALAHYAPHEKLASAFLLLNMQEGDVSLFEGLGRDQGTFQGSQIVDFQLPTTAIVRGWDDMLMYETQRQLLREIADLGFAFDVADLVNNPQLDESIADRMEELGRRVAEVRRLRNVSMEATIAEYPDQRIFVVGGDLHFSSDPKLLQYLDDNYKFVVLTPIEAMPEEEERKYPKSIL